MSGLSRFVLAVMALFTIGMIVHDPEEAHRPPPLRDDARIVTIAERLVV